MPPENRKTNQSKLEPSIPSMMKYYIILFYRDFLKSEIWYFERKIVSKYSSMIRVSWNIMTSSFLEVALIKREY